MEKPLRIEGEFHLPEAIIQQLQSFLSAKEAARTTILSKSWHAAWSTRPNLEFSDLDIPAPHVLLKFAKETMQKYEESNRKIQSFRLRMDDCSWINIYMFKELIVKAMKLGTTDLDVKLYTDKRNDFVLPLEVLESETLVRLSLRKCRIYLQNQKVSCSGLKYLSLSRVYIEGNTFWDIILMCPLIEELVLSKCKFGEDEKLESKSVLAGVYAFNKLKVLSLNGVRIGEWLFSDFSSGFPCLKDLSLKGNIGYKEIQICSNSLECISFAKTSVLRAKFDVPRLRKFKLLGLCVPSLSFKKIPRESDISFVLDSHKLNTSWFLKLREFLLKLSPSNISLCLSMRIYSRCDYHIRDIIGLPTPPVVVENLTLMMCAPYSPRHELLDDLFWCCRPTFVTLYLLPLSPSPVQNKANNDFTELLCKVLRKESGETQSMSALHDLEEVNVECFGDGPIEEVDVSAYSGNIAVKVCLQLRWGGVSKQV
ncbi:hypothetical protein ACS0TY_027451 [Phlomoides rotata]